MNSLKVVLFIFFCGFGQYASAGKFNTSSEQDKLMGEVLQTIKKEHILGNYLEKLDEKTIFKDYVTKLDGDRVWYSEQDMQLNAAANPHGFKMGKNASMSALLSVYERILNTQVQECEYALQKISALPPLAPAAFAMPIYPSLAKTNQELNLRWDERLNARYQLQLLIYKTPAIAREKVKQQYQRRLKMASEKYGEDPFATALNALLSSQDRYLRIFFGAARAPSLFSRVKELGLDLDADDETAFVVKVDSTGPSANKIHPGDRIIGLSTNSIEYNNLTGENLVDVVKSLQDAAKSKFFLRVLSKNFTALRVEEFSGAILQLSSDVSAKQLTLKGKDRDLKIGVLKISELYADFPAMVKGDPNYKSSARDARRLLTGEDLASADGIVLDLRDNGGGALIEADAVASLFMSRGVLDYIKEREEKLHARELVTAEPPCKKPLIVLINENTGSGAELVAAALGDHQRALIVGQHSYGFGSVFQLEQLSAGTLRYAWKLYRANGQPLSLGVDPHIEISTTRIRPENSVVDSDKNIKVPHFKPQYSFTVPILKLQEKFNSIVAPSTAAGIGMGSFELEAASQLLAYYIDAQAIPPPN